ncbi:MAG: fatty acid--CoA ligase family protein [Thermodesulfovibrionia bacterium]
MRLDTMLHETASRFPKRRCIKFRDEEISYADLDRLVSLVAGGLNSLGLGMGERTAILMENCPQYIISYFAILRAGGVAVPINTMLTPDEVMYILQDSGSRFIIYGDSLSDKVREIRDKCPDVKALHFGDIPKKDIEIDTKDGDELAVLLYTSGTTGFPKGAMLTHSNLISNADSCMRMMDITHKDRILLFLPLFHSFTFTVCVILPIYAGATIVLLPSVKPFSRVVNAILKERITFFVAVPTVYNILSRRRIPLLLRFILRYLLNVRACISGAAPLPVETIYNFQERFGVPLLEGYGLTEASPVVSVNPLNGVRKPSSVGPPIPGVEVAVVGDDGRRLPVGGVGELIVKGPNVMKGYFNREDATREAIRDGWLYTGDMAKIDEDGYIYIVDRKKDLIIVDGMNVYPREVEDVVLKLPSVEECAMIGIPDGRGSEITVLYIKPKEGYRIDDREVREHLKRHVAHFKIPRRIISIDEFPKTATGKIKKAELRVKGL